jgi:hypothetical protein
MLVFLLSDLVTFISPWSFSTLRLASMLGGCPRTAAGGFPHSDILGSSLAGSSPRPFVACHVLPRRSAPRHPPPALSRFCLFNVPTCSRQWIAGHALGRGLREKPWSVRAGRLHPLRGVHLPPSKPLVSGRTSAPPPRGGERGRLISGGASRLDAVSAYRGPTWLPGGAPGGTARRR